MRHTPKRLTLAHSLPRMSIDASTRVGNALISGCHCGSLHATLTQRLTTGSVTVHLQCGGCGRSVSGSMPKRDHYEWQSYPVWDTDLIERVDRERAEHMQKAVEGMPARHLELQTARQQRREAYHAWLLTSPEWAALRERVLTRARYICEACLNVRAGDVHHETYELGKLPPAWLLKAVCRPCHDRLHAGWQDEEAV